MAEEVFPEPENDNEETNARTKEEKESRALKIIQQQVALLMDELKRIFHKDLKLTFIARDPNKERGYTFLTEEADNNDIIEFLKNVPKPTPVDRLSGNS